MISRLMTGVAAMIAGIAMLGSPALAQGAANYPDHTVRIIVPFPAGGATDIVARLVADKLQAAWGKPVVVENISGAAGMTGTSQGLKSDPDGHTMVAAVGTTTSLLASLRSKIPYDPINDYAALALVTIFPNMLVVRPDIPAKTLPELIALVKANPGKYTFASTGAGSSVHIAGEWFKLATKSDILHVPYTGSSPALPAILGGHVDMMFDTMPSSLPLVQSGKLRALGVGTLERVPVAPEIPAISETIPGFDVASWEGFIVPKATPADIQKKIADAIIEGMKDPEILAKFNKIGALPVVKGQDGFRAHINADYEKWKRVTKETGIKLD